MAAPRPKPPVVAQPTAPLAPLPRPALYVFFQGARFAIQKDEFIIGRSAQGCDLVISNSDISRRHASVVYQNGAYLIQDNNSINGIEHNGYRIQRRTIEEGDIYQLAGFELRFTYQEEPVPIYTAARPANSSAVSVASSLPVPTQPKPSLTLVFQGQRYPIEKDEFVIGRATQINDLVIRDGNLSRKHALVVYRGGGYFIQDNGSTNGIDYNGMRIDNKKIEEGDVFYLGPYELRFTYQ